MKIQTLLKKDFKKSDYFHIANSDKTEALIIYTHTDSFVDYLISLGYRIEYVSYGISEYHDFVVWKCNTEHLKHISYDKLKTYDTDILYRMRNCLSYFHMLDDETKSDISDILYDRYWDGKW